MSGKRIEPITETLMGHYSGFISRFVAFSFDTIIVSLTALLTTWFISITANILQLRLVMDVLLRPFPGFKELFNSVGALELGGFIYFFWVASYHIFFWVLSGQTPGKALIGLRVVCLDGGKITWWRAIIRYFGYFISGILLLGFIWVIFDDRRQAWHDKLSGTCVIYTWPARPDERFLAQQLSELDSK